MRLRSVNKLVLFHHFRYWDINSDETSCCEWQLYAVGHRLFLPGYVEFFSGTGNYERKCWCEDEAYGEYGGDKECSVNYTMLDTGDTTIWIFPDSVHIFPTNDYDESSAVFDHCEEG